MYRFNNMLALLEADLRAVPPEETYGGRNWSNYTWHGDQSPGHPFVHGLQASGVDFAARGAADAPSARRFLGRGYDAVRRLRYADEAADRVVRCFVLPRSHLGDSRSARGRGGVCRDLFR